MIRHQKFVQDEFLTSDEWKVVEFVFDELIEHLSLPEVVSLLRDANQPSMASGHVQKVMLGKALELGFKDESNGLFEAYPNNRLRPDYYLPIGNTGILFEVERGKTNQNNMDFLDFWKCHICHEAHYLFLCVPIELRQNESGKVVGRPFQTVVNHMSSFFIPINYTNVRGIGIIGY